MKDSKPYCLDKLAQYVGNDESQVKEMINLFLTTIPPDIDQLKKFSEKKEWFEVYKLAHKIKPSFEVFAMDDILEDIKKIEHLAKEDNADSTLNEYLHRLSVNFESVTILLENELE